MSNFDICFEFVVGHEGGYGNHPNDPGRATKYGISQRAYPGEDIKNLTLDRAKFLYKRDYWDKVRGDELPGPIALLTFDAAVNAGVFRAAKWLQEAAGANPDGAIGPNTLEAVRNKKPADLLVECLTLRNLHNASLNTWTTFGKGWSRRLFSLPLQALQVPV